MQDAFAYCAELVRAADRDRYLAALFAPAERRGGLHALYAFCSEIARVREVARQPLSGEIRLQWWTDVLRGEREEEARANPVAAALLATVERYRLASSKLLDLVDAHRFDLYEEPMPGVGDLEDHLTRTSSALFALAAQILADIDLEEIAVSAGIASGIAALLYAFPRHAARRQLYVPIELLERHRVHASDIFAGRSSAALNAALAELRRVARNHLATVQGRTAPIAAEALPAFLPIALVRPLLDRLERSDAFAPVELAPWRRQWLIWRAARNPARMTR
jgi:15-cis-phytoene synthase